MNSKIKGVLIFSLGAAVGVAASWKYFKTKYEQIAHDEIEDVKEVFLRERGCVSEVAVAKEEEEVVVDDIPEPDIKETYVEMANEYGPCRVEPYVISPEELGDVDEFDTTTLYYYADGVLADLEDEIVEDVDGTVGADFASHFGEYEDDSVCVRNENHRCDYEILKESRTYAEAKRATAHGVEG